MASNMTFKANLNPQTDHGYELGSSSLRWKINGVADPKLTDTTYTFTAGTSTLAWNSEVTLATVGGLAVKAKLPTNPNSDKNVQQNAAITTAGNYPIILAYSTATTVTTNTLNKSSTLLYNPSTTILTTPKIKVTTASYGTTLPASGEAGQLFFQTSTPAYELPTGGTAGYALIKNTDNDRDVTWGNFDNRYVNLSGDQMTGPLTLNTNLLMRTGQIKGTAPSATTGLSVVFLEAGTATEISARTAMFYAYTNANNESHARMYAYDSTAGSSDYTHFGVYKDSGGIRRSSSNARIYGAVWNDYAEYRITKEDIQPGRVIKENGDDTLSLTTKRLERGCEIVSDTFGFAIGETEISKTPTATVGRVLAYPYESLEEFKSHIGWPVCSGPNGTVSIMTEEEEEKYSSRILGTISGVPDYEIWSGENPVKVNGRVWIRVR